MWIIDGILAGLIAGIFMGLVSQIGYRTGILKSHLIVIDGKFVLLKLKQNNNTTAIYTIGLILHLITSVIFGVIYVLIAKLVGFEPRSEWILSVYVLILLESIFQLPSLFLFFQGFLNLLKPFEHEIVMSFISFRKEISKSKIN